MVLDSFRVTEFRSVQDSGWIDAEQITALIGTNESGKTNILLPLWKLNPADDGKIDLKTDLPRDKYHTYRSASPKPVFIYAKYVLTMDEQEAIAELSGHSADELSQVVVSKDFDENLFFEFPFAIDDSSSMIEKGRLILEACKSTLEAAKDAAIKAEIERREKALESIGIALELLDRPDVTVASLSTAYDELKKFDEDVKSSVACVAMSEAIQKFKAVISESSKPHLSETETVTDYIKEHMPKYVYYSNYGNLDSQIYLPQVLQNIGKSDLGVKEAAKARTLRTLFKFVHLNPKEITDLGTETTGSLTQAQIDAMAEKKKEREILLSSASSAFTKSFNEWWKQGNYTFEFQADGNFFRISVSDTLLVNCNPVLVEGESDQVYLSALKNLLISKGKIAPLKEIVFIPTGGVKGIKATSAILSGAGEIKPPVLLDGDKPGMKMATELKSDFYAVEQEKVIIVSEYTALHNGEIEDLFPKKKIAKIVARFLPRPEEVDEEFDDVIVEDLPVCDQVEVFAKTHGIDLEKGWKVRLATTIKREVLRGTDKIISETDPEFGKIVSLFERF